jgi:hypothetical protein
MNAAEKYDVTRLRTTTSSMEPRNGDLEQPPPQQRQGAPVAVLPGALAHTVTSPASPARIRATLSHPPPMRSEPVYGSPPMASSPLASTTSSLISSGSSFNGNFVNQQARRMRRLSTSHSQTVFMDVKDRLRVKATMVGALSRDAKAIHAAHGDELGDQSSLSRRSEPEADRCAQIMERDCCCGRCKPIEGDGKFRRAWDAVQVLLLLYVAVMVPLRTGFDESGAMVAPLTPLWWVELVVDLYFIVDIGLNFNTTYVDSETMASVRRPAMIKANYLKTWFTLDFVACLPISYLQQLAQSSGGGSGASDDHLKLLKSLRLFRLAKLLRLARLRRIIKRWEDVISASIMFSIQLATLFFAVLFSAHIIACLWYLVGSYGDSGGAPASPASSSSDLPALDSSAAGHLPSVNPQQTTAHQTASLGVDPNQVGWVHRVVDGSINFADKTLIHRYLRTYYWSVGLTSGSARGDIPPIVTGEYLFVISMEVVGTVALGLILGSLSSMFMTTRLLEDKVERQMAELREYLTEKRIPKKLRNRVRHYMELLYRKKTGYNEQHLMALLPPSLGRELIEQLYRSKIDALPGMRGLPDEVRAKLCMAMKPIKALKTDIIFREGERADSVYVIEDGVVELSRNAVVLTQLSVGAAFGEDSLVGEQHADAQTNDGAVATNMVVGFNAKRERTATAVLVSDHAEATFLSQYMQRVACSALYYVLLVDLSASACVHVCSLRPVSRSRIS